MMSGSLAGWMSYLDIAIPAKPSDWSTERERIVSTLSRPERMQVLTAMTKTTPADAGAQLPNVACPVLIVMGGADPDWSDPRAEGERILSDLPAGRGELAVIDGAGHYPHAETPDEVVALLLPFLAATMRSTARVDNA